MCGVLLLGNDRIMEDVLGLAVLGAQTSRAFVSTNKLMCNSVHVDHHSDFLPNITGGHSAITLRSLRVVLSSLPTYLPVSGTVGFKYG